MHGRGGRYGEGERGVSTVIAVVLMVAMTVLLVAVVATFALGFGGDVQQPPAPQVVTVTEYDETWDANGQYLNISHESGAILDTDRLRLDVNGAEGVTGPPSGSTQAAELKSGVLVGEVGSEFSASETLVLDRRDFTTGGTDLTGNEYIDLSDATVRIIYEPADAERSTVLYECRPSTPDCEQSST
jgi:flagellin-like protein